MVLIKDSKEISPKERDTAVRKINIIEIRIETIMNKLDNITDKLITIDRRLIKTLELLDLEK